MFYRSRHPEHNVVRQADVEHDLLLNVTFEPEHILIFTLFY